MLPKATEAAWGVLRKRKELGGFTLIGGTALALRIAHRLSEDLDLVWRDLRLPSERIRRALAEAELQGISHQSRDNPAAVAEFEDSGLELHDYQQDYLLGETKVSFFAADQALQRVLSDAREEGPRLATLEEIFATKCLVSAQRSRTRDWFDLYVLMRNHGFSLRHYVAVFEQAGNGLGAESGLARLCAGQPDKADEGFLSQTDGAPTLEQMREYFRQLRDELEVALAAEKFRRRDGL